MPRRLTKGARLQGPIALVAGAIALACSPLSARANGGVDVSGGAGIDYQSGPRSESYRGALLFATANAGPGDLTIAAIRYEDSQLGPGVGGFASVGASPHSRLGLRGIGVLTQSDTGFDSWRLRAGPELRLDSDVTLGAFYLRHHDDSPLNLNAGGLEVGVPLSSEFSAQAGFSYGRWNTGETTAQGTLAGRFRAGARLLLLCEVDVGRNVTTTSSPSSSGGGVLGGLPLAGALEPSTTTAQSETDRSITSAAQLGVRFLIP